MVTSRHHYISKANGNGSYAQPIIVGIILAVLQAFWGLAYSSLQSENMRLNVELKDIRATYLSLREHEEYARSRNRQTEEIRQTVLHIQTEQNTRGANLAKIDALEKRVDIQFTRIEEVAKGFGATFTPGAKLQELQRQIEILQERWTRTPGAPVGLPPRVTHTDPH